MYACDILLAYSIKPQERLRNDGVPKSVRDQQQNKLR